MGNEVADIMTIDSVNKFRNWNELAVLIKDITEAEAGNDKATALHIADTSALMNPNDHPDHIASAFLALKAYENKGWNLYFYREYETENLPANISALDSMRQQQLFNVYNNEVTKMMGFCTTCYTNSYALWCGRLYRREMRQ